MRFIFLAVLAGAASAAAALDTFSGAGNFGAIFNNGGATALPPSSPSPPPPAGTGVTSWNRDNPVIAKTIDVLTTVVGSPPAPQTPYALLKLLLQRYPRLGAYVNETALDAAYAYRPGPPVFSTVDSTAKIYIGPPVPAPSAS